MSHPQETRPVGQSLPRSVEYMSTREAYNLWAKVYDSDGNILQVLDNQAIDTSLPSLISTSLSSYTDKNEAFKILDLGCGTGRNTVKLIYPAVRIIAVDNSSGMMAKAHSRLQDQSAHMEPAVEIDWVIHDLNDVFGAPLLTKLPHAKLVDAVISTLVLEHIPLQTYFRTIRSVLKPGGWFLLTNMHPEMGKVSQAGFVDTETGKKVRPISYNYSVEEVLQAAADMGLVVRGEAMERGVRDDKHAKELGLRAEKWVGIKMHLMFLFDLPA